MCNRLQVPWFFSRYFDDVSCISLNYSTCNLYIYLSFTLHTQTLYWSSKSDFKFLFTTNIWHQESGSIHETPSVQHELFSNEIILNNLLFFDAKNYDKCCKKMKVLFGSQDVLEVIKNMVNSLLECTTDAQWATHKK